MRRVVFLSGQDLAGQKSDDELAVPALQNRGFEVEVRSWQETTDWEPYAAVVIRSTWDYYKHPEQFLGALRDIPIPLFNCLPAVEWNLRKTYLSELEVAKIPTHYETDPTPDKVGEYIERYGRVVAKPVVAAGGFETYRLSEPRKLRKGRWMLQPYLASIEDEGEYSLIYFNKVFSHAVCKRPAQGEFRIQEIFGGSTEALEPCDAMLQAGAAVLARVNFPLLYARVDLVREQGRFLLMELELVEPSLYFYKEPASLERFAEALEASLQ